MLLQNKAECMLYGINRKKGLLVSGPEGSGKTSLMQLLKLFFQLNQQYFIRSSSEIVFCSQRFGNYTLQQYLFHDLPYCFDDLGMERFKLDTEVIKELLQYRLLYAADNTHISTRLQKPAIIKKYGKDFSSMLYNNLNPIEFTKSFNF